MDEFGVKEETEMSVRDAIRQRILSFLALEKRSWLRSGNDEERSVSGD